MRRSKSYPNRAFWSNDLPGRFGDGRDSFANATPLTHAGCPVGRRLEAVPR